MNSPISTPEVSFAPITFDAALLIEGIGPGFLRIGPHVLRGPLMVSPWGAQVWGGLGDTAAPLTLAGRIDVLIFGGGKDLAMPPGAFREPIEAAGIGIEPMSTASAARFYNQLIGEGRRVAMVGFPLPVQT
jgi:uncharacterized protein